MSWDKTQKKNKKKIWIASFYFCFFTNLHSQIKMMKRSSESISSDTCYDGTYEAFGTTQFAIPSPDIIRSALKQTGSNRAPTTTTLTDEKVARDLNLAAQYSSHVKSGVRELVQNWRDRVFQVAPLVGGIDLVRFNQVPVPVPVAAGVDIDVDVAALRFVAVAKRESGSDLLLGTIMYSRKEATFEAINIMTNLTLDKLVIGNTTKAAFGEGMKVEINQLVAAGASVTYRSGNAKWSFEHQSPSTASSSSSSSKSYIRTLHAIVTTVMSSSSTSEQEDHLCVTVTGLPQHRAFRSGPLLVLAARG